MLVAGEQGEREGEQAIRAQGTCILASAGALCLDVFLQSNK